MLRKLFDRIGSSGGKPPCLKQFADLRRSDFERFPVWVAVHTMDYDEPWYDDTNEETFRPWTGTIPVDPAEGIFLVRATLTLADGSKHPGFLSPAELTGSERDLETVQPQVFPVDGQPIGFWLGAFGFGESEREEYYRRLGRGAAEVFPATFAADEGFTSPTIAGVLAGFYAIPDFKTVEVFR